MGGINQLRTGAGHLVPVTLRVKRKQNWLWAMAVASQSDWPHPKTRKRDKTPQGAPSKSGFGCG